MWVCTVPCHSGGPQVLERGLAETAERIGAGERAASTRVIRSVSPSMTLAEAGHPLGLGGDGWRSRARAGRPGRPGREREGAGGPPAVAPRRRAATSSAERPADAPDHGARPIATPQGILPTGTVLRDA